MFYMQDHQLIFSLFKLAFKSGNLFLVIFFYLFQLQLQKCQFFHGFLNPLLILAEHAVSSPRLRLKCLVDVLELNNFALKVLKLGFELISLSFDQLKFLFQRVSLSFLFFLYRLEFTFCEFS